MKPDTSHPTPVISEPLAPFRGNSPASQIRVHPCPSVVEILSSLAGCTVDPDPSDPTRVIIHAMPSPRRLTRLIEHIEANHCAVTGLHFAWSLYVGARPAPFTYEQGIVYRRAGGKAGWLALAPEMLLSDDGRCYKLSKHYQKLLTTD